MTTSTKLSVVAAFLLSAASLLSVTSTASAYCGGCCAAPRAVPNRIHIFCLRPVSVNDPVLFGGASLGYLAASNSPLQNSRHYPHGPDPLKGQYEIAVWCPSCAPPPPPPPSPCCR
jgi:hypothetical protein